MKTLTASDRKSLIRLASSLPKGSPERRAILAGIAKTSGGVELDGNTSPIRDLQRSWPRISWKGTPVKKLADYWQAKLASENRNMKYSSVEWVAAAFSPQLGLMLVYEVEGSLHVDNRVQTVGPGNRARPTGEGDVDVVAVQSFKALALQADAYTLRSSSEFLPNMGYRSLSDVVKRLKSVGYQILWPATF